MAPCLRTAGTWGRALACCCVFLIIMLWFAVDALALSCTNSPCMNGATCTNTTTEPGYNCTCTSCYTGSNCSTKINLCTNDTCLSHGACDTWCTAGKLPYYLCYCYPGYNGMNCESDIDECDATGTKVYCESQLSKPSWCFPPACSNGGRCSNTPPGNYSCDCSGTGYTDLNCRTDVDECRLDSEACFHHGNCSNTNGSYSCDCFTGYEGQHCATANCSLVNCSNGGTCDIISSGRSSSWRCNCPANFTGVDCSVDVDECSNGTDNSACFNHGTCTNLFGSYSCNCSAGYEEPYCAKANCSLITCENNGTCGLTKNGTSWSCSCPTNYYGTYCEFETPCVHNPCENGGTCTGNKKAYNCTCSQGWAGNNCSDDINECTLVPSKCQHNASCTNTNGSYNCNCSHTGYQGKDCSIDVDECSSTFAPVCKHNGTCSNTDGSFTCNCVGTGFTDSTCSTDIDECNSTASDNATATCSGHGNCTNAVGSFSCSCMPAYFGTTCQYFNSCSEVGACGAGVCSLLDKGAAACDCSRTGNIGPRCDVADLCSSGYCKNGGNCSVSSDFRFSCTCPVDYLLPVCSVKDPCFGNSSYCGSGGVCIATVVNDSKAVQTCNCTSSNMDPKNRCLPVMQSESQVVPIAVGSAVGGVALIIIVVMIVLCVLAKQKRAMQGVYSPSRQEMAGSRVELGNVLKPPPEERLI